MESLAPDTLEILKLAIDAGGLVLALIVVSFLLIKFDKRLDKKDENHRAERELDRKLEREKDKEVASQLSITLERLIASHSLQNRGLHEADNNMGERDSEGR